MTSTCFVGCLPSPEFFDDIRALTRYMVLKLVHLMDLYRG